MSAEEEEVEEEFLAELMLLLPVKPLRIFLNKGGYDWFNDKAKTQTYNLLLECLDCLGGGCRLKPWLKTASRQVHRLATVLSYSVASS